MLQAKGITMLSRSSIFGLALAAGVVAASAVVAKDKESAFGAIAIDFTGVGNLEPYYGLGAGATEEEATANALKFCAEAGGKNCKMAVTFPECGAYAASRNGGGSGKNTTKKTAEAAAISGCNDDSCKIVVSDCN
jgi:hypothetical protein